MTYIKPIIPLLFLLITSRLSLFAQIYYEQTPQEVNQISICNWPQVSLYAEPGQSSEILAYLVFGEALTHLGQEAIVKRERNNYLLVEAQSGEQGWVDDQYVVRNGGVVVLLEDARIYNKPSTYSAATGLQFEAGELLILSDWQDNWVYLTGEKGRKSGWTQGYDRLSVDPRDLEIAGMLRKAMTIPDDNERLIALRSIIETPDYIGSPVRTLLQEVLLNGTSSPELPPINDFDPNNPEPPIRTIDEFVVDTAAYLEATVYDPASNAASVLVKESGRVQAVAAKNPPSITYAYHKTVPIGETITLQSPDGSGFIELKVIARLKKSNPNVIGLGKEVIKKVFGVSRASEIPSATIIYAKPE